MFVQYAGRIFGLMHAVCETAQGMHNVCSWRMRGVYVAYAGRIRGVCKHCIVYVRGVCVRCVWRMAGLTHAVCETAQAPRGKNPPLMICKQQNM
jgi:hypothetical protein